jgi:hypothetical protein
MKRTTKFRLYPTTAQEQKLHEIITIYNKVKRMGYKLFYKLKDSEITKNEKRKLVQPQLKVICQNNPYVNSILIDCEKKLAQQHAWLEKRESYLTHQVTVILEKIKGIKEKDEKDRRLRGLYSRLSSIQNKLCTLRFKPVTFGTKRLFRERILGKISRDEFRIRRDSSFCCVGKKQGVNLNLKLLPDMTLRIHSFFKEKGKNWIIIPFTVNFMQEKWFHEILGLELYQVEVVRRLYKGNLRYFAHVSYEAPQTEPIHGCENGAVGLDMNYNFVSLSNVDKRGNFKSYR